MRLRGEVAGSSTDGILIVDRSLWREPGQWSTDRGQASSLSGTAGILPVRLPDKL